MIRNRPAIDRFWDKVHLSDGCWEWTAAKGNFGYGVAWFGGRLQKAHRVSWQLAHESDIPPGMFICHRCDNPACVRPDHLFLGTATDNARDMVRKGRNRFDVRPAVAARVAKQLAQTHCKRGHEYSAENTRGGKTRTCKECENTMQRARRARGSK